MGFKKSGEFKYNIETMLGTLKESDKHDWIKAVMRVAWGDNPTTLDVRSLNPATKFVGKGISLTNEEADKLVDILLQNDYGTLEELEAAVKRKRDIFSISNNVDFMCSDDGDYFKIDVDIEDWYYEFIF